MTFHPPGARLSGNIRPYLRVLVVIRTCDKAEALTDVLVIAVNVADRMCTTAGGGDEDSASTTAWVTRGRPVSAGVTVEDKMINIHMANADLRVTEQCGPMAGVSDAGTWRDNSRSLLLLVEPFNSQGARTRAVSAVGWTEVTTSAVAA